MKLSLSAAVFVATSLTAYSEPTLKVSTSSIQPETSYQLVFDKTVVSTEQLHKPLANDLLSIKPSLDGTLTWTARNVAEFHPTQAPELDTTYHFSTAKGRIHHDGSSIPVIELATKSSPAFKSDYHRKYSHGNNRQPISYLRFNDDVTASAVANKFYYINKAGIAAPAQVRQASWADLESSYYVRPSWNDRFEIAQKKKHSPSDKETQSWAKNSPISNGLIITPSHQLSVGESWTLVAKKGIPNTTKTTRSAKETQHYIWNITPYEISRIIPVLYADDPRCIYVEVKGELPEKIDPSQFDEHIQISPSPGKVAYERYFNDTLKITGDFNKHDTWKVSISKDFQADNGLMLGKDHSSEITFKSVESSIALAGFDVAQLSKGERTLNIDTVNMQSVRVQVKSLTGEQAIRAMQGYRHYSGNGHNSERYKNKSLLPYELISGTALYDTTIKLDNALDTSQKINLSWDDILPKGTPTASLFVSITGLPKDEMDKERAITRRAQSLIHLTDLGLAWKVSNQQTWVYAYSLDTGDPLANVTITTYGEDAKILNSVVTNTDGLAKISNTSDDRHLIANLGKDQFTVTFDNSLSTVSMWRFPVSFTWSEQTDWDKRMMLFTDRNLYRPGDTVRCKGILREALDNQLRGTSTKKVTVSLRDRRNKVLKTSEVDLSEHGSFSQEFTLPDELVGSFKIRCALQDGQESTHFTHYFSVQEFRRNAFEVKSKIAPLAVAEKEATLDVSAAYYQGTPVAEGFVKWYASMSQSGFYPAQFRDYLFGDHRKNDNYYWSHYFGYGGGNRFSNTEHSNGTLSLTSEGAASVELIIPDREFPSPQRIKVETEVTDSRDQTLYKTAFATQHPTSVYFGVERVDELVRVGDTKSINLVAVNTDGKYTAKAHTAELSITREYFESTKILAPDGTTRTTNEKRLEDVLSSNVELMPGQPTPYTFSPEKPGRYILTFKGADTAGNKTATASSIYVYGEGEYPWATEDGLRIKLVSEQKNYKPGDTARLLVMTPIEGSALVTIERKGIMKSYRRQLKADNPVIEIPIEKEFAPNAYVSVLVMRGSQESPRKHKQPALKLGYCTLNVTDKEKQLVVTVDKPSNSVLPASTAIITGTVVDHTGAPVSNAEVTFFAEDEGTLAVMGFQTPNPFKFFNRPISLSLRTGVSLGYFLEENPDHRYMGNKGFTIGGGDSFGGTGGSKQIQSRSNFDPCAAWLPNISTDENGKFVADFITPDTLTRYRLIALALHGDDKFGSSESELIVKKDLMLEPKPPRFANEGDTLETRVLVQNASKFSGEWNITLSADSHCMIPGSTNNTLTKSLSLNAGESATLSFPCKFTNTGKTTWSWTATPTHIQGGELTASLSKQLSDAITNSFDVAYPRPLLRQAAFAEHDATTQNENILADIDNALLTGRGHIEVKLSNSLLLEAAGASEYLLKYPYGCVEQTTSSMMPWLAVNDLKEIVPGFGDKTQDDINSALQKGVDRLLSMQTRDGGLAYWPGGTDPQDWATSYGGMGLVLAQQQGAQVPQQALDKLAKFLQSSIRRQKNGEKWDSWRSDTHARSLYVLSLLNQPQVAAQNKLYEDRDKLTGSAKALLALAIHHSGGEKQMSLSLLDSTSQSGSPSRHWMRYRSDIPSRLLAWSTIAPTDQRTALCMQKLLETRNPEGHWHTTWVNGWAMHAMASYAKHIETNRGDVLVTLETENGKQEVTLNKQNPTQSLRLSLEDAKKLNLTSNGKAYSNISVAAKPQIAPVGPVSHKGLTITRRYELLNDAGETSPLDQPKVGDLVKITLEVGLTDSIHYLAIDDPLPSIFESVNTSFASQGSAQPGSIDKNYRVSRKEFRNDRTLFFFNRTWGNDTQKISYLARVTAAGTVHAPPAKAEPMYAPSEYALSEAHTLTTQTPEAAASH